MKTLSIAILMTFLVLQLIAQERSLSGRIFSLNDKTPIAGANIILKGTSRIVSTNEKGEFLLSLKEKDTLVVSCIGFLSQEIRATDEAFIKVFLKEDIKTLSEVVVVGYGKQVQKNVTGSISTVTSKEIQNLPFPGFDQMIQGRASGVLISSNSGEAGSGILVRVRGATSISATSDPLYVIDGVPVASGELAKMRAGSPTNALADINPNDIESVHILKDASASSIYGARGANGVVLITTKKGGFSAQPSINLNLSYGISQASKNPDKLRIDGPTFERLQNEAAQNNWIDRYGSIDSPDPKGAFYVPPYADPANATDTNWLDEVFQKGSLRNIDLSIKGGSERVRYYLSGAEYDQQGIIKPASFNRKSGRLNLEFLATDKIKLGTNISLSSTVRNRVNNGNDISGAFPNSLFYPTNIPVYNPDGTYNKPFWESPVAAVKETDYKMKTERLIGNFHGEYEVVKGLIFKTSWGVDKSYVNEYRYFNTKLVAGASVNGSAASFITSDNSWINENTLSFVKNSGFHYFDILAGNTIQESTRSSNQAIGQQFPSDAFKQLSSAAVIANAGSSATSYGLVSYFGRINYAFKDKYLATVNIRRDGSSRFGPKNRWGTFSSASFGWVISEENFLNGLNEINHLKIRASYGITGNQNGIDNFQSLALWGGQPGGLNGGGGPTPINNIGQPAAYVSTPGFVPNQLGNPNLKWETTSQLDLGIDISLFQNKLSLAFDYYNKQTKDLLLAVPVPRSVGYNQLVQNYGAMENKGWELKITETVVSSNDLTWNVSLNLSQNKNKVTKLVTPFNVFSREFIRLEEGYPLHSFWVHKQKGLDHETGDIIWETGADEKFDPNVDRFIAGSAQPDLYGGFSSSLNYKNIDCSFFFQFTYGNEVMNYNRYFFEHGGERTTGYTASQLDRWQKPGDDTDVPRMVKNNYSTELRPSRFVEDGSYLRLKNLEIGYSLPSKLISKIGMKRFRIYVSSQNLWTLTRYSGLDPEVSVDASELISGIDFGTVPQTKSFIGGINITF